MSEKKQADANAAVPDTEAEDSDAQEQAPDEGNGDPSAAAKKSVNIGRAAIGLSIILSLAWYLAADRHTPYTSQARVEGYVVGVAPKVQGVVTDVFVQNGQEITVDQPLFQIDRAQYEIALAKARSDLESAKRQVDAGTAGVESARAALLASQANEERAEKDFNRLTRLRSEDPGTISQRRLESSQASLDQARANVTRAESEVQRAIEQKGGEDDAQNAQLAAARSAVDRAELDLANTLVRASADGLVTDLRTDVGQFAAAGTPVMTMISIRDFWISAEFTENNLGNMRVGSPVEILFDSLPGRVFSGKIRTIGYGVSSGSTNPPGTLPEISNNRDFLRQAQRFPVAVDIDFDAAGNDLTRQLRVGGQTSVIAYTGKNGLLNLLGKVLIRLRSLASYAY